MLLVSHKTERLVLSPLMLAFQRDGFEKDISGWENCQEPFLKYSHLKGVKNEFTFTGFSKANPQRKGRSKD